MANPKKMLASAAVAAGLLGGGVVGVVLGAPGVSGAQTTTVPETPGTTVAPDDGAAPDRPARGDREHCPDKEGGAEGTNLSLRVRGAGRV
jgi:hypothetical protein